MVRVKFSAIIYKNEEFFLPRFVLVSNQDVACKGSRSLRWLCLHANEDRSGHILFAIKMIVLSLYCRFQASQLFAVSFVHLKPVSDY